MVAKVKVTHTVDIGGLDRFEATLNTLAQKMENAIKSSASLTSTPQVSKQSTSNPAPGAPGSDSKTSEAIRTVMGKFSTLTTQIQSATNAINDFAKSVKSTAPKPTGVPIDRGEIRKEREEADTLYRKKIREEKLQSREDDMTRKSQQRWKNIGTGILAGSMVGAMYQAGNIGQVIGSESRSMNVGANDYSSFMRDYYNRRVGMEKSMGSTGIMAAAGTGMAYGASVGGLPGIAIGAASGLAGGIGNYLLGSSSEKKAAMNEFALGQDPLAYRLQARGISDIGDKTIRSTSGVFGKDKYIPITGLQSQMMSDKNYAGYTSLLPDVMSNSRADVLKSTDISAFTRQVGRTSFETGEKDVGGLSRAATNLAAMSGKDPTEVLKKQTANSLVFGGKVLANMDKITNIMQHTGMGESGATSLVNRYQFNDAALQNKVNMSMLTPQQGAQKTILRTIIKQMTGLEPDAPQNVSRYRKAASGTNLQQNLDPVSMMLGSWGSAANFNYWTDMGGQAKETSIGSPKDTSMFNEFMDTAYRSISEITVGTQTVHAGIVNINGEVSTFGAPASGNYQSPAQAAKVLGGYGSISDLKKQVANVGERDFFSNDYPEYKEYMDSHPALAKLIKDKDSAFHAKNKRIQANKSQVGRGGM
jgi:hypothetical protein